MSRTSPPFAHKNIGVAVISDKQGKILIDKRKTTGEMGGLWEFPGGKIESGETAPECIKREIKEELDIEITVDKLLTKINHTYKTFKVTLHVYSCQYLKGEPKPLECEEIHWVSCSELGRYQFPQANNQIIQILNQGRSN